MLQKRLDFQIKEFKKNKKGIAKAIPHLNHNQCKHITVS